jgi:hypothetical protein
VVKKTEPFYTATAADWEAVRRSRPEDYDGHTGFATMTPAARLVWLDGAAEFVFRQTRRSRPKTAAELS